jgi:hypothetical protein
MAGRFLVLLQRPGQLLFRADDEFARRQGWQVETGRFGLSRVYRDPRFDLPTAERADHGDRAESAEAGRG